MLSINLDSIRTATKTLPVLLGLVMVGCGDTAQLPPGAEVRISPVEKEWTISPNTQIDQNGFSTCVIDPGYYQDEFVTVSVADSEGRLIGGAEIILSLNLSANTFSGPTVLSLFDDVNGDFIPDESELVSGIDDGIYVTTTDKYSGAKNFIVRMNLSCTYVGQLVVASGGYSSSATFITKE